MRRKPRSREEREDNGFAEWGGYMAAKVAKLQEQYKKVTCNLTKKQSDIFNGVSVFVNGYTTPSAEELKYIMAAHGGTYHTYQVSGPTGTTHIIASVLPNVKAKQLGSVPIVKANWITDSIAAGKCLDYRKYLLYTNQNRKQPTLDFPVLAKETDIENPVEAKPHSSRTLTAADPRFLAEFYQNSRLHLISTLGAEYKQLVSQLREKSDGTFPGREKLKLLQNTNCKGNEPVVMHIDMDCFFVSVGIRNRPELQGKPVAVTHARSAQGPSNRAESIEAEYAALKKHFPNEQVDKLDPNASMSEIASCSYEARKCGVRNGMFLGSAKKLCPNLQTIPYDFQGYREVSHILYNTIAAYTLDIEAVSCDEMYVDVGPILHEASITVEQWATHIRKEIMDITGCPCSTGFGANRLQARLATKKAKPAGQFHLKPHEVEMYMAEVLLADLPGVGYATVAKLGKMGLKTCGDVQMASLAQLQAELGQKAGETIVQQARGIDRKPLNFQHERKSVSADVNYGIRFKDNTEALNFLQSLSTEVWTRLQDVGLRARCLTLKLLVRAPDAPVETPKFLGCGVCTAINRSTTTGSLISDAAMVYKEAKTLFERANVPPVELRGVGIQLTRLEKPAPTNTALSRFLAQKPDKNENNEVLVINKNEEAETKSKVAETVVNDNKQKPVVENQKPKTTETAKAGKRGRPKGKPNSKPSKKPVNSLNKYFKVTSSSKPARAGNIDLNVLSELPEDLRKEIIKEYQLEDKMPPKPNAEEQNNAEAQQNPPKAQTLTPSTITAFDGMDWEDLKPIILNWLKSDVEPANIDITMLAEYFKQLAIDRKIEVLKIMLSFLYRHVAKLGLCSWHSAYLTIVNTMQEGMVARYGSTLMVERCFACALHC